MGPVGTGAGVTIGRLPLPAASKSVASLGGTTRSGVHTITFQPGNVVVPEVPAGQTLLEVALRSGVFTPSECAGVGSCGKCVVRVEAGRVCSDPTPKIGAADWERGVRLACTSRVSGDADVYVPESARKQRVRGMAGSGETKPQSAEAAAAPFVEECLHGGRGAG